MAVLTDPFGWFTLERESKVYVVRVEVRPSERRPLSTRAAGGRSGRPYAGLRRLLDTAPGVDGVLDTTGANPVNGAYL